MANGRAGVGRAVIARVAVVLAAVVIAAARRDPGRSPRRHLEQALRAPGWHDDLALSHGGLLRHFRTYVPRSLPPRPPVVVLLHGGTQSMRKIFRTNAGGTQAWPSLADAEGFLLLVPNGVNADTGDTAGDDQTWNDCRAAMAVDDSRADDVGFVTALLDWAASAYGIDPARAYATGLSNGGGMSFRLAVERPDRFAAVAVFIMAMAADTECPPPAAPVPVLICNGTEDPLVPWNGGAVAGGDRGTVVSAAETLAAWLAADDAGPQPDEAAVLPDLDPDDGCTITSRRYLPHPGGAEVVFLSVLGGGHTVPTRDWPVPEWVLNLFGFGRQDRDVEGARLAWEFLRHHRLPTPP